MYEIVCFDFDGTLVDSNAVKKRVFFDVANLYENGYQEMQRILQLKEVLDRNQVFCMFAQAVNLSSVEEEQVLLDFSAQVHHQICQSPYMQGAIACLKALKRRGTPVYLNSATPTDALRKIIKDRKIEYLFSGILGRPQTKVDNIKTILKTHNIPASRLLVVGDGEDDEHASVITGSQFMAAFSFRGSPIRIPLSDLRRIL